MAEEKGHLVDVYLFWVESEKVTSRALWYGGTEASAIRVAPALTLTLRVDHA